MAAWLLYAGAIGVVLGVAGLLAERGLRHLDLPVRWAWAVAMASTAAAPAALLVSGVAGAASAGGRVPARVHGWSGMAGGPGVGTSVWEQLVPGPLASGAADGLLLAVWIGTSLALLASLRLSAWTVRRNERGWSSRTVDGERVQVSTAFGPGVIGAVGARIVLPAWVLGSAPWLRRLIVRHEIEHVRAGDTRLLRLAVTVTALLPWCLPLWWQLDRLRAAIETDCDARVLAATGTPRAYANALVSIAGRPGRRPLPVPALAPRPGELERRIRLIAEGRSARSRKLGLGLLFAAALGVVTLGLVPAPAAPVLPALPDDPEPGPPPAATVILTIDGPTRP